MSKSLYAKTLFSIFTSRSKNQVWFPWRSTFSSNFLEQIFLNNVRNSLLSFIAQRSSLNRETLSYLYTFEDLFEMLFYTIRFKEIKKVVGTNWCGSIPIVIPI